MEKSTSSHPRTTAAITIRPMDESDVPELLRLMRAIVSFECGQDFTSTKRSYFAAASVSGPSLALTSSQHRFPLLALQQLKYPARQAIARSLQGGLTTAR